MSRRQLRTSVCVYICGMQDVRFLCCNERLYATCNCLYLKDINILSQSALFGYFKPANGRIAPNFAIR
jgi:hypothetical protein